MIRVLLFLLLFCLIPWSILTAQSLPSTIKFTCADWPPINTPAKNNKNKGVIGLIVQAVFENRLNINVTHIFLPWKRAQWAVENGNADFLITVPTNKRLKYSIKSETPFFQLYLYIYTYQNHPKIKLINQIKSVKDIVALDLTAVTNLGNEWHKENIENQSVNTHHVRQEKNIFAFLAAKRADIAIEEVTTANHIIQQNHLSSKLTLTKAFFGPVNFHLLMSKKSPFVELMPQIDAAMSDVISSGTIDHILDKYK